MPKALRLNPVLKTDSYKLSHWPQYPPDTEHVYSYLMSRGGFWKHTLFSGAQYILDSQFVGKVFTKKDVEQAAVAAFKHFGNGDVFNYKGWMRLLEKHGGMLRKRLCILWLSLGHMQHSSPHFRQASAVGSPSSGQFRSSNFPSSICSP